MLKLAMVQQRWAIGIDIGGTNTKGGLVSFNGEVLDNWSFKTENYPNFTDYFVELKKHIVQLMEKARGLQILKLDGIGIGAPNAHFHTGFLESPVNIPWGRVPLKKLVEDEFKLPVIVDNDANASLLGESLFGTARGFEDVIQITLGTGVGTGLLSQGKVIRGINGKAGEGGHIVIAENGRVCGCGGRGHLEAYASSKGLRLTVKEISGQDWGARELGDEYKKNNPLAVEAVRQTCESLGKGLSTMCALLNPSLVVLSGGVSLVTDDLAKLTQHYLDHYNFPNIKGEAQVVISRLSQKNGSIVGAAALIWEKELSSVN